MCTTLSLGVCSHTHILKSQSSQSTFLLSLPLLLLLESICLVYCSLGAPFRHDVHFFSFRLSWLFTGIGQRMPFVNQQQQQPWSRQPQQQKKFDVLFFLCAVEPTKKMRNIALHFIQRMCIFFLALANTINLNLKSPLLFDIFDIDRCAARTELQINLITRCIFIQRFNLVFCAFCNCSFLMTTWNKRFTSFTPIESHHRNDRNKSTSIDGFFTVFRQIFAEWISALTHAHRNCRKRRTKCIYHLVRSWCFHKSN